MTTSIADLFARNAARLLDDARILRKQRRYASAMALAILSLEETGKVVLAEGLFGAEKLVNLAKLRLHPEKQQAATRALIWSMANYDMTQILQRVGYRPVLVPIDPTRKSRGSEETPDRLFSKINLRTFDREVARHLPEGAQNRLMILMAKGEFSRLKAKALYLDLSKSGAVQGQPSDIRREDTDRIIRLASRAKWITGQEMKRQRKVAMHFSKLPKKNARDRTSS